MKSKKFDKRLAINKSTVANLNTVEMGDLKGGTLITVIGPICNDDTRFECYTENLSYCAASC
jgi:hypothetical protein